MTPLPGFPFAFARTCEGWSLYPVARIRAYAELMAIDDLARYYVHAQC
jgi:hypothetical protein